MGFIEDSHKSLKATKWIGMSYLLSFVSGWLTRQMVEGKIKPEDKAALFILLATVLTLMIVLGTVGMRRWRNGELSMWERRLMYFSLSMYPLLLILGYW